MTFSRKFIDVSISLASGSYAAGGNKADIKGHRVVALIRKPGGADMAQLECAIYGLPLSVMNQLTTLGTQMNLYSKNTITLKAYEEGQQPAMVFEGNIHVAFADMRAMPETCLRISALAGLFAAVKPVDVTSQKGSTDVAQTMEQIAKKAELKFENNGVNTKIVNPYLPGSARQQAHLLAKHAGIEWIIDNGTLAIWPAGKSRNGGLVKISPTDGMIGYPAYNQAGIEVTARFNPAIQYGRQVEVESDLKPACGTWTIVNLDYALEAEVPKGKWQTTLTLGRTGGVAPQ
ncbi:baseplate hub protein [Methylobacterium frigidaeris]|uniref:Uncharacterized protein n=1 Tax=Methylobacterium frigidaeris TaxID=2038277 RepID=A0AA37M6E9_9HYPH|nr:hypothetical protein [Methylobacterium frigidaeris]GJD63746.1 hypothetical protein MPEAHAMD_3917 [Methylobacterium frigidaeris]